MGVFNEAARLMMGGDMAMPLMARRRPASIIRGQMAFGMLNNVAARR